jgi:hypothetical protein
LYADRYSHDEQLLITQFSEGKNNKEHERGTKFGAVVKCGPVKGGGSVAPL